jgi:hypothetical protein
MLFFGAYFNGIVLFSHSFIKLAMYAPKNSNTDRPPCRLNAHFLGNQKSSKTIREDPRLLHIQEYLSKNFFVNVIFD